MLKLDIKSSSLSVFLTDIYNLVLAKDKTTLLNRYNLKFNDAVLLSKEDLSLELEVALSKYNSETNYRGLPFLNENIQYFLTVFTDVIEDFLHIEEAFELGMPKVCASELFNINTKFVTRFMNIKTISKSSSRKISCCNAMLIINQDIQEYSYQKYKRNDCDVLILDKDEVQSFIFRLARISNTAINRILAFLKSSDGKAVYFNNLPSFNKLSQKENKSNDRRSKQQN